ncbi:MAG TPA: glycosyltransferase [Actinoplanes sp.]|nr:glycosyltransferase [Actinoplanes sp.]
MRIAHFSDSEPGRIDGVSVSAGLSVALLREAGHRVCYYHPGPIRTVPVPLRHVRLAAPWLRIDPGPVDVVHAHTTGPIGMAGFRLARLRGVPLVITWHTDLVAYADHFVEVPFGAAYCAHRLGLGWTVRETLELAERHGRRHSRLLDLGRAMMSHAGLVIAPSEKTAAGLAQFGDLPPVCVLPTPVRMPEASGGDRRAALGLPPGTPVVLSVGRVTTEKNPGLLLRAFARLRADRPDAHLVVVGVRQNRRAAVRLVRRLGLTGHVHLVPPVPRAEVAGYYRMADVLAFASTTDTQSLVVAEAESLGLPVVLADAALAAPASYRVTCAPTPAALAAALLRMLGDGDLRERTVRAGRAAAVANSPERYLTALAAAYRSVR